MTTDVSMSELIDHPINVNDKLLLMMGSYPEMQMGFH